MRFFAYTFQSLAKMGNTLTSVSMLACRPSKPSPVLSFQRFERSCYMHAYRTPSFTTGIGLPRQYKHSCFF